MKSAIRKVAQTVHALPPAKARHSAVPLVHQMAGPRTGANDGVMLPTAAITAERALIFCLLFWCKKKLTSFHAGVATTALLHRLMLQPLEEFSKRWLVNVQATALMAAFYFVKRQVLLSNELLFRRLEKDFGYRDCKF
jgi:hypothetical protein